MLIYVALVAFAVYLGQVLYFAVIYGKKSSVIVFDQRYMLCSLLLKMALSVATAAIGNDAGAGNGGCIDCSSDKPAPIRLPGHDCLGNRCPAAVTMYATCRQKPPVRGAVVHMHILRI